MTRKRPERRGDLSGLLGNAQNLTRPSNADTLRVPIEQVSPYLDQPRRSISPQELATLAESIRQKGVLQPLLVRPAQSGSGYEIAAGERRYRASLAAGLNEVPVLVREFSDEEMLEVGLVENLQRENLSVIDEVEGKLRLVALKLGVSVEGAKQRLMSSLRHEVAADADVFRSVFELTGKETWQSFAKNKVRILQWPEEVLDAMRQEGLAYGLASVIAGAPESMRAMLLERAKAGVTVQELRRLLTEQQSGGKVSKLETEVKNVSQTLGRSRWVRSLNRDQQAELQKWLKGMPAWMK